MKKFKLNKLVAPIVLSSIATIAQAEMNFGEQEYYVGASVGMSKLADGKLKEGSFLDALSLKHNTALADSASTIVLESAAPITDADKRKTALDDAISSTNATGKALLVKDGTNYKLPSGLFYNAAPVELDVDNITSFAAFVGMKSMTSDQLFVGVEAQGTMYKEKYQSAAYKSSLVAGAKLPFKDTTKYTIDAIDANSKLAKASKLVRDPDINDHLISDKNEAITQTLEYKRKYAFSGDLSFGKRFDVQDGVSVDLFGVLGYGFTEFDVKNNNSDTTVTTSNILDSDGVKKGETATYFTDKKMDIKDTSAKGLRYGFGLTVNLDQQFGITGKFVKANLKNTDLFDDDLTSKEFSLAIQYRF